MVHPAHPASLFNLTADGTGQYDPVEGISAKEAEAKLLKAGWIEGSDTSEVDADSDGTFIMYIYATYTHPELGMLELTAAINGTPDGKFGFSVDSEADVMYFEMKNE